MILDKLDNSLLYAELHPGFKIAFDFVKKNDLNNFLPGKYSIVGDRIIVLIDEYETKGNLQSHPEAHKKYIDIQLMVSGSEMIGYASKNMHKELKPYEKEKDIAFFDAPVNFFELKLGMFAIFFRDDLHQPGIALGKIKTVKKAVFKVLADFSGK